MSNQTTVPQSSRDNEPMQGWRIRELRAENQRLREAIESIAKNTCCEPCQEAALVARQALAGEEEK